MFVPVACPECAKPFQVREAEVNNPSVCPWCLAVVRVASTRPETEPLSLDDASPAEDHEEAIRALRRRARSRVKLPATLILMLSILGMGLGIAMVFLSLGAADGGAPPTGRGLASWRYAWAIGPFAIVWCGIIGYGAFEMDRLGNYKAALVGSWLAVIPVPVPGYCLWFIGAILGLLALQDPAVRAAFNSGNGDARAKYLAKHPYRSRRRRSRPDDDF